MHTLIHNPRSHMRTHPHTHAHIHPTHAHSCTHPCALIYTHTCASPARSLYPPPLLQGKRSAASQVSQLCVWLSMSSWTLILLRSARTHLPACAPGSFIHNGQPTPQRCACKRGWCGRVVARRSVGATRRKHVRMIRSCARACTRNSMFARPQTHALSHSLHLFWLFVCAACD